MHVFDNYIIRVYTRILYSIAIHIPSAASPSRARPIRPSALTSSQTDYTSTSVHPNQLDLTSFVTYTTPLSSHCPVLALYRP